MTRKPISVGFFLVVVAGLLFCLALNDVMADRDADGASGSAVSTQSSAEEIQARTAMMITVSETISRHSSKLEALRKEIDELSDEASILAKQREIERLSLETEKTILRLQADYARKWGRTELASHIDEDIRKLEEPAGATRKQPATRKAIQRDEVR
jgi:TolA-binding protein